MRAFVTGGGGFVGRWLVGHLEASGDEVVVGGRGTADASHDRVDVTDAKAVRQAVLEAEPHALYHLAALAHVGESWEDPEETFRVNALGSLHVLEAARVCPVPPTVLLVGSAEVYGIVRPEQLPLTEEAPLAPVTPYAASKVAAEFLGVQAHLGYRLPVVRARAFNHVGPGQSPAFVVASLARQIVERERRRGQTLRVGNLESRRDFTDVRDVVRAYRLLVERGRPGQVYNVCSGEAVAIETLARQLVTLSGADLTLELDPERARSIDLPVLRGDPSRLGADTGWRPRIPLHQTLRDVLDDWRARLG